MESYFKLNQYREKIFLGIQVFGHLYCSSSFKTSLGFKLSMENQVHFLHKYGTLFQHLGTFISIWDKVFKSGPSKICGRQRLKNLKGYGLLKGHLHYKAIFYCKVAFGV